MFGFVLGLALGMFFGLLCYKYRIPPWYAKDDDRDALLLCRGNLERKRARLYSLRRQAQEAGPPRDED